MGSTSVSGSVLSPASYRDNEAQVRQQVEELQSRLQEGLRDLEPLTQLYASRVGRIVGGATGTLFGLAFLAAGLVIGPERYREGLTVGALAASWFAVLVAAMLGKFWGELTLPRQARRQARPTGDLHRDLARLEATPTAAALVTRQIDRLEQASLALPLVALALLTPLTLQAPFALGLGGLRGMDMWCFVSVVLVGHAHLVLAGLFIRHAARVRRAADPVAMGGAGRILLWTVVTAGVPGLVLYALPPILTLITGAVFIPLAVNRVGTWAAEERAVLEAAVRPPAGELP
jgi:hypothetical protein